MVKYHIHVCNTPLPVKIQGECSSRQSNQNFDRNGSAKEGDGFGTPEGEGDMVQVAAQISSAAQRLREDNAPNETEDFHSAAEEVHDLAPVNHAVGPTSQGETFSKMRGPRPLLVPFSR